ncbi:hypothetical protein BCBBV1cgp48 [Bacillus phage BCASJ1c]|uniref:48 n=1 Tax=Bacillus phage BCASJ1c TaxID=294382 RepID=Q5YA62_9CAUD|nr:hypothetical protein BCBBV1cgp48 [Bacillus phage BCASJ1c]AAU85095.1 48 [Bacillus phage BCASJ1c]
MRLNDPLITSFVYKDQEYAIDLAFDNVLDVFDALNDHDFSISGKIDVCLKLLLNRDFEGQEAMELWNHIYEEFIHIEDKQRIEYDLKGNLMPQKEQKRLIDFERDAEYIFASFQQAYHMNLFKEQGKLHWREFQALLNGLPSNTIMQRIIQIRMWEPQKGDSNEYKQKMLELQKVYALEDPEEEEVG